MPTVLKMTIERNGKTSERTITLDPVSGNKQWRALKDYYANHPRQMRPNPAFDAEAEVDPENPVPEEIPAADKRHLLNIWQSHYLLNPVKQCRKQAETEAATTDLDATIETEIDAIPVNEVDDE